MSALLAAALVLVAMAAVLALLNLKSGYGWAKVVTYALLWLCIVAALILVGATVYAEVSR